MNLTTLFKGSGLKERLFRSSMFTSTGFAGQSALRLLGNLILTRLLFPEAFGIMAIVQVVIAGLTMFSDLGIRASIIQNKRGEDPVFLNTAYVMQISRGLFLWLATLVFAAPLASFYNVPELAKILPVAGLIVIFQGFNSTKMYTLNRELALGRLTVLQLVSQAIGLVIMVSLALAWGNIWALVIGGLIAPFLVAIGSHIFLPGQRNRFVFEMRAARQLIGFGKYVFLATIAGFLVQHADRAILGKLVSLNEMALYTIAFFFASIPLMLMRRLVDMVVFPLYSKAAPLESDDNRLKIARAHLMLKVPALLMLGVLAVFGNDLIILLYDPRYESAGLFLVLIAIAQMPVLIIAGYGSMTLAAGDSGWFATLTSTSAFFRTIVLLWGVQQFGLIGAIIAPAIATILFYPVLLFIIRRYKGQNVRQDASLSLIMLTFAAIAVWANPEVWTISPF